MPLYTDDETGKPITTQSMMKTFKGCPREAFYKYQLRLQPKAVSKPLRRGTWFHALLEAYYKGEDWEPVHETFTREFNKLFDEERFELGDLHTEISNLFRSYIWHYGDPQYKAYHWKVHETELKLSAEMPNGHIFRGVFDMLVEDDFGLWLVDHKCLDPDTPVTTPFGLRRIGDLNVGDLVVGSDGNAANVIGASRRKLPVYEITLRSGKVLRATGEHKWPITHRGNSYVWTTNEIAQKISSRPVYMKPSPVVKLPEQNVPIHPYLLGALIGDGTMITDIRLCTSYEELRDEALQYLPDDAKVNLREDPKRAPSYRITSDTLRYSLRDLGLWGKHGSEKFLPEIYLTGSEQQRRDLLAGLMDTDGSQRKGLPLYMTGSEELARDVSVLVESLGGVATIRENRDPLEKGYGNINWTVLIRLPRGVNPHRLKFKADRLNLEPHNEMSNMLKVESIKEVGVEEVIDIEIDTEDHLFIANGVLTHNTHKRLPDWNYRMLDEQSTMYTWLARANDIPVLGFIWNYATTEAITTPKLLASAKSFYAKDFKSVNTDYPTFARAVKAAMAEHPDTFLSDPAEKQRVKDRLAQLKAMRWSPESPASSPFFRRDILEKTDAQIERTLKTTMRTSERMHSYDFSDPDAVERNVDQCKGFMCSYKDLNMADLIKGDSSLLQRQNYISGDPLSYQNKELPTS